MSVTLPSDRELTRELTALLNEGGFARGDVVILERELNIHPGSYPNEIVRCTLPAGDELELLCKYGFRDTVATGHGAYGSRRGVEYEAAVYRQVLAPSPLSAPRFYGSRTRPDDGDAWLVVEFVGRDPRISLHPDAMTEAARWLAAFHGIHTGKTADFDFLTVWDRGYYRGYVDRAVLFLGRLGHERRYLEELQDRFDDWTDPLLRRPTVVHGEFYPDNVLYRNGRIYPVDWESAAIGAAAVDLATLTEQWEPEVVERCEEAYCLARWGADTPADFHQCLLAARLFVACRWLGEPGKSAEHARRLADLRRLAREVGVQ